MTNLVSDRIPTRTRTERAPEITSRLNLKKKTSIYLRKSTFLVAITTFAEPSVAMWHHGMLVISYLVFVLALGSQEPKALFPSWPWRHVKRVCQGFFFVCFWERSGILSYLPLLSLSIHPFLAPATYTCCHVYVIIAAAAAFPTARSQERRHLLCPLCRSLAGCQTEPMPIKSHE